MSQRYKEHADPKTKEWMERAEKRDHRIEHIFRRVLHIVEILIATLTILALLAALGVEVYRAVTQPEYFSDISSFLHHILTIVVGLEFVRMIIDTTPANILEVLTVAITRHVLLSQDDPWSIVACVACIAGLFAIRRFLIRRSELKEEMLEQD
ncbi:MAG: hypothetical protein IJB17_05010 [Oscillospiraceae bacterium]|nr:hypothetical protein [Oscillospiraceae bacterium]